MIAAVSSVILTAAEHVLQPEFAAEWSHPMLRITSAGIVLLSLGFILVLRSGRVRKQRLLDLGMFFQVAIAFACGLWKGAAMRDPKAPVVGHSAIAVWMMLCGRLMPNAPLRSALTAVLCVLMWPLSYWVDLEVFGYQPMPAAHMMVWILPLAIVAMWMYVLNNRSISLIIKQQQAEEMGSYVLDSRIGAGGMGEVWRAKHKTLARDAAIKLIRPEMLQSATGRQEIQTLKRFEREAQATASLRSPHTVALYDFGKSKEGAFYYVMELLDGIDLQRFIELYGPMEPARVVKVLQQICESLEEAHLAGLVHRDIKPRNILLCKLGLQYDFVKVLDFGLVKKRRSDDPAQTETAVDGVTGTPAYLAPEIAMGTGEVDGRADLYSLGCTAYFLLTGKLVFDAATPTAYAMAHVQNTPPPMRSRSDADIPAKLEQIVMDLLAKDPADRIQTAGELARQLRCLPDARTWSPERAEQWWKTHGRETAPQPEVTADPLSGATTVDVVYA
jgi:serine/threonine-protein kinase